MAERPRSSPIALLFCLAVSYAPALTGAAFPPDEWSRHLIKPTWNPPDWLFGPVWMTLYFLIGVAVYRVAHRDHPGTPVALTWFFGQLVLNALWTPLFFGLHRADLALAELHRRAVAGDRRHDPRLSPRRPRLRRPARAVPAVGQLRHRAQRRDVVAQSLTPGPPSR